MKMKKLIPVTMLAASTVAPITTLASCSCAQSSGNFDYDVDSAVADYKPDSAVWETTSATHKVGKEAYLAALKEGKVKPGEEFKWLAGIGKKYIDQGLKSLTDKDATLADTIKIDKFGNRISDFKISSDNKVSYTLTQMIAVTLKDLDVTKISQKKKTESDKAELPAIKVSGTFKFGYKTKITNVPLSFLSIEIGNEPLLGGGDTNEGEQEIPFKGLWFAAPNGYLLDAKATDWSIDFETKTYSNLKLEDGKPVDVLGTGSFGFSWNANNTLYKAIVASIEGDESEEKDYTMLKVVNQILGLTGLWMPYYMSNTANVNTFVEDMDNGENFNPINAGTPSGLDPKIKLELSDGQYGKYSINVKDGYAYKEEPTSANEYAYIISNLRKFEFLDKSITLPWIKNANLSYVAADDTDHKKLTVSNIDWNNYRRVILDDDNKIAIVEQDTETLFDDENDTFWNGVYSIIMTGNLDLIHIGIPFKPTEAWPAEVGHGYADDLYEQYGIYYGSSENCTTTGQVTTIDQPLQYQLNNTALIEFLSDIVETQKVTTVDPIDNPISIESYGIAMWIDSEKVELDLSKGATNGSSANKFGWELDLSGDIKTLKIYLKAVKPAGQTPLSGDFLTQAVTPVIAYYDWKLPENKQKEIPSTYTEVTYTEYKYFDPLVLMCTVKQ